jgi:hypothetical protein
MTAALRALLIAAVLSLALAACVDEGPRLPTTLVISNSTVTFDALGASQTVSAAVLDQHGKPMLDEPVTWSVNGAAVKAEPESQGARLTAIGAGTTVVVARAGAATAEVGVQVTQVPAMLEMVDGDAQSAVAGSMLAAPLRVVVRDRLGAPIVGQTVTFTVQRGGGQLSSTSVDTEGPNGVASVRWTVGPTPDSPQEVVARVVGLTSVVTFTAVARRPSNSPPALFLHAGGNQAAMAGSVVPIAPAVVVRDAGGVPVSGARVDFTVVAGAGAVTGSSVTTGADGVARVQEWRLGPVAGPNTLRATLVDQGTSLDLVGAGCVGGGGTGYEITLCYTTPVPQQHRAAFEQAAARWSQVVTGNLSSINHVAAAGTCGAGSPRVEMNVDDLVILVAVEYIDGPGFVLGSAGPCYIRNATDGQLPWLGRMRLDVDDLDQLAIRGLLADVILHEMGHVMGLGTLWTMFDLVQLRSSSSSVLDTHYTGLHGRAAFDAIGGTAYTGGLKVPVENTGGAGTMNAHWRENVLGNELMTGWINSGRNPLSLVTVRALEDLGYQVDPGAADAFMLGPNGIAASRDGAAGVHLHDDVWLGPLYESRPDGTSRRVR